MSPSTNDAQLEVGGYTYNTKEVVDKDQARETTKTVTDWVVYKDERIVIINKPSGIPVQGGTGVTTSIDSSLSVLQDGYPEKPRLVHRLDRTTSGLLVVARTRKAAQDLASRFHSGANTVPGCNVEGSTSRIQKKYIAIVGSAQPVKEPGRTSKYASESKTFRLQGDMVMTTEGKTQTIQMASRIISKKSFTTKLLWPSATDVTIAAQNYHSGTYWALLNLHPWTGRKHQLRVHCAQLLNAPILGDIKYSGAEAKANDGTLPRIYLHMAGMELKGWVASAAGQETSTTEGKSHRITKEGTLVVTASLEDDMQRTIERLGLS
ncbi:hypothetical protein BGZ95_009859 [Linnemannia exigua]|uniref:21S rRNA pseudouridine(2819) synthase n=1 Tax=Linnemannia exigua TaxID=604196 RepID=A0AAD4DEB3_9FUNG|nr:hypothetical protein BGZ95_009859 [Linnemannia exigua]